MTRPFTTLTDKGVATYRYDDDGASDVAPLDKNKGLVTHWKVPVSESSALSTIQKTQHSFPGKRQFPGKESSHKAAKCQKSGKGFICDCCQLQARRLPSLCQLAAYCTACVSECAAKCVIVLGSWVS